MKSNIVALIAIGVPMGLWICGWLYLLAIVINKWMHDDKSRTRMNNTPFAIWLHKATRFNEGVDYPEELTGTAFLVLITSILVALSFYYVAVAIITGVGIAIPIYMYVGRWVIRTKKAMAEFEESSRQHTEEKEE